MAGLHRRAAAPRRERDRGGLSLMLAVMFPAVLVLAGIVVDGGAKLTGDEDAAAAAQEAARAAATSVDAGSAYGGSFAVGPQQAAAAAGAYLRSGGYRRYTVTPAGPASIRVSVQITRPTKFLSMIGIGSFTCSGSATATLVTGVAGPGGAP